uniref:Uncharacterized protein n=1 Tax=Anguilla anguilla TaxID=7936 RepID=A0A0E9WRN5_ANGAN
MWDTVLTGTLTGRLGGPLVAFEIKAIPFNMQIKSCCPRECSPLTGVSK